MAGLPPLADIMASPPSKDSPLAQTLAVLFEPSPVLFDTLVPELGSQLRLSGIASYSDLIFVVLMLISQWPDARRAQFIAGHPRIGDVKQVLSALSTKEQAATATPPDVLARLEYLNACYEQRYPDLRYITFVNGRSRAEIAREMEGFLGLSTTSEEPPIESFEPVAEGSEGWKRELERAVTTVGKIATSRLKSLGVEYPV